MGIELFNAEDREILASHIGELHLSDALLERFLASAVAQASEFAAANEHPEPTEAEAVAQMMRNMRIALGHHSGEDGRLKAAPVTDLSENFADLMFSDETTEEARQRLTLEMKELRHVLQSPSLQPNPDGSVGLTQDQMQRLQDLERRQALGKWLNA